MDVRIGNMLKLNGVQDDRIVDVNYDELHDTLGRFGEYQYEDKLPVHVYVDACFEKDDNRGGYVVPAGEIDGVTVAESRIAVVPLFHIKPAEETSETGEPLYWFVHDPDYTNTVLAHELKHVVDFNDTALVEDAEAHKADSFRRFNRKYIAGALAVSSLVGVIDILNTQPETRILETSVCAFMLWAIKSIYNADKKTITSYKNHGFPSYSDYRNCPLEERAWEVTDEMRKNDSAPNIISVKRTSPNDTCLV